MVDGNYWGLVICNLGGAFTVFVMIFEGARRSFFELQMVSLEGWGGLARQVGDQGRLWFGFELQNRTKIEVCWAEVGAMLRPSRNIFDLKLHFLGCRKAMST